MIFPGIHDKRQDYVLFSTGVLAVSKQVDAASAFQRFDAAPEAPRCSVRAAWSPGTADDDHALLISRWCRPRARGRQLLGPDCVRNALN